MLAYEVIHGNPLVPFVEQLAGVAFGARRPNSEMFVTKKEVGTFGIWPPGSPKKSERHTCLPKLDYARLLVLTNVTGTTTSFQFPMPGGDCSRG